MQQSKIPPAAPAIFGRDTFIAQAIDLIKNSQPARLAILSGSGMGKTSTALTILHHRQMQLIFGDRCYFVSCEAATSTSLLLQAILQVLGVQIGSEQDPLFILHQVLIIQSRPLLLVLDNFETPWDESDDQTQVESVLSRITALSHVTLMVTMRGTIRPAEVVWTQPYLPPLMSLSLDAARQTFLKVNPDKVNSQPELDILLKQVECVPLAVKLIAQLAQSQSCSLLLKRWSKEKITLLHIHGTRSDRLHSVEVSISLSLKSFSMADCPEALDLLALISLLPDGVLNWQENLEELAPGFSDPESLAILLINVALAYVDDQNSLKVLSPIRHYMLKYHPAKAVHMLKLERHYIELVSMYGRDTFSPTFLYSINKVKPEIGNMTSVMLYALQIDAYEDLVQATYDLASFMSKAYIPGALNIASKILEAIGDLHMTNFKPHCFQLIGEILCMYGRYREAQEQQEIAYHGFAHMDNQLGMAYSLKGMGKILYSQNQHTKATEKLDIAYKMFMGIGSQLGAAQCLHSLGNILYAQSKFLEAKQKLETAHKEFMDISDQFGAAQCMQSLGNIAYTQKDLGDAQIKLKAAHRIFKYWKST